MRSTSSTFSCLSTGAETAFLLGCSVVSLIGFGRDMLEREKFKTSSLYKPCSDDVTLSEYQLAFHKVMSFLTRWQGGSTGGSTCVIPLTCHYDLIILRPARSRLTRSHSGRCSLFTSARLFSTFSFHSSSSSVISQHAETYLRGPGSVSRCVRRAQRPRTVRSTSLLSQLLNAR